jgi:myo-inositol-1(or 4)-monophosphatase
MRSALYNVISAAVQKALRPLGRDIREIEKLQVSRKGIADFVTSADTRTEKILKQELGDARPEFGFITEESDKKIGRNSEHFWIIDYARHSAFCDFNRTTISWGNHCRLYF